jgi:DNA-binding Lrp family transcriptional regulator
MREAKLDHIDRSLLNLLQAHFPLSPQPFAELGAGLGLDEEEVIERIGRLKRTQVIRYIGPIFDSRSLGYRSTLVAMRIPEERLERAVRIVNEHPGVSHNYARSDTLNLWFTLAVPPGDDLKKELQALVDRVGPEEVLDLPAVRLFKIGVFFDMAGDGRVDGSMPAKSETTLQPAVPLSASERAIVRELQRDIPLTSRPFDDMAQRAGVGVDEFLSCCRALLERGVMRRFGASLRHQNVGFAANAMVCWRVAPPMVEGIGRVMSAFSEVSHCYEREASEGWPYNVFTMIHGRTREDCQHTIGRIVEQTGVEEYRVLFTVKEFKKERVRLVATTERQA